MHAKASLAAAHAHLQPLAQPARARLQAVEADSEGGMEWGRSP